VEAEVVLKIQEGRPNATDLMKNGDIAMMFITSAGDEPDVRDGKNLRRAALALKIPVITTVAGAKATTQVGFLEVVVLFPSSQLACLQTANRHASPLSTGSVPFLGVMSW